MYNWYGMYSRGLGPIFFFLFKPEIMFDVGEGRIGNQIYILFITGCR